MKKAAIIQHKYRKRLSIIVIGYGIFLLAMLGLSFWPPQTWAFANLFNFSPHWLFVMPAVILIPVCLLTRQYSLLLLLLVALGLCVKWSGWVFNIQKPDHEGSAQTKDTLVVISANMGYADYEDLNQLIVDSNADLISLQEVTQANLAPLLKRSPLNSVCVGELCLLSHLNLKLIKTQTRKLLHDQGEFAMQVEVSLTPSASPHSFEPFDFYVIHLKTPREGFQSIIDHPLTGWDKLFDVTEQLIAESWITSNWVAQGRNPIAAGDFNLPRNNPIFTRYWRGLVDSFEESGNGLGYSKHTRWHGVQIDHILHSPKWTTQKTWIGPSLKGDHSPVITILNSR